MNSPILLKRKRRQNPQIRSRNDPGGAKQKVIARIVVFALLLTVITVPVSSTRHDVTVITGATVIDCTGRPPIPDGVVVIEGDKIKAVGRKGDVQLPGARAIDASGKYVLPGLIDMHVHYREWQGELFLANGVTTVKDLGNPVEWISQLSRMQTEGKLLAPRVFYVGNNLDAPPPEGDHNVGVANARECEKAVRLLGRFGVCAIKVRHKISPDLLREITKAAHSMGLPVTGHLAETDATEAVLAGIDGLEHATAVARAAAEAPDKVKVDAKGINAFLEDLKAFALMSPKKEALLVKLLVEKQVRLIPTIAVRRRAFAQYSDTVISEDLIYARNPALAYVPEAIRRDWSEPVLDRRIREAFGREQIQMMQEGYHRLELFVREFHRAGGRVLAGSDNLSGVAGLTLHRELESLVAAGLTPTQALFAATRDAAQFLGRDNLGTIEPGKVADLVICDRNPLDDMRNLRSIEKVFQNGRELETGFHRNYALPPARPELARPLLLERLMATKK